MQRSYRDTCTVQTAIVLWKHARFIENAKNTRKLKWWYQVTKPLKITYLPQSPPPSSETMQLLDYVSFTQ